MERANANPRALAAGRVCVHCGKARLDGFQPPEHPIPLALGSQITTYTTCVVCQPLLSANLEKRWLADVFVQFARTEHPTENRRTRRTRRHKSADRPKRGRPTRQLDAAIERHLSHPDGHSVLMRNGRPYFPGSAIARADGSYNVVASSKERMAALLSEIVGGQLDPEQLDDALEQARFTPSINELGFSDEIARQTMALGMRMGAKMGLSFAAEALPESWRLSPAADRLRRWLWSDRPADDEGNELGWIPNPELSHPLDHEGKHFVHFGPIDDELHVLVRVLSSLGFCVPLGPLDQGLPSIAWASGAEHSGPVVTSYDQLIRDAAERSPLWSGHRRRLGDGRTSVG